jgi:hypothetical protein
VAGRLPVEVDKRILRIHVPRLRACYQQGLKGDPTLKGSVAIGFVIDATGAVESVQLLGNTTSSTAVAGCMRGALQTLSFPEPEEGKVVVKVTLKLG